MRALAILAGALCLASAAAADELPPVDTGQNEMPAGARLKNRRKLPEELKSTEELLASPADEVDADEVLDEMLDELASDIASLGTQQIAPVVLERIRLSNNMNPEYAAVVEARLAAAVYRATSMAVVRCVECWATQSRVENGEWIVTRGIVSREQMQSVAKKYGARGFLTAQLSMITAPNPSLVLDVELVRAVDGGIAFAESYRIHPQTALLYRAADKTQTREARLKELQERLDARPRYGHAALFGTMYVPSESPLGGIWGASAGYRLYEVFGATRGYRVGLGVGGFMNASRLAGAILNLGLWKRMTDESVDRPTLFLGGQAGGFLTGTAGNTPILSLTSELLLVHRIAVHGSLSYMFEMDFPNEGKVGGFCPTIGAGFIW